MSAYLVPWELQDGLGDIFWSAGELDAALIRGAVVDGLESLRALQLVVEKMEDDLVIASRKAGLSWAAIGAALGMSRQAAWEKFSKRLDS